jgi:hypothetical protein
MITIASDPIARLGVSHLLLLLYVGPDQALPLLSFVAAILGFLLMCGRRVMNAVRRMFVKKSEPVSEKDSQTDPTSDSLSK